MKRAHPVILVFLVLSGGSGLYDCLYIDSQLSSYSIDQESGFYIWLFAHYGPKSKQFFWRFSSGKKCHLTLTIDRVCENWVEHTVLFVLHGYGSKLAHQSQTWELSATPRTSHCIYQWRHSLHTVWELSRAPRTYCKCSTGWSHSFIHINCQLKSNRKLFFCSPFESMANIILICHRQLWAAIGSPEIGSSQTKFFFRNWKLSSWV